MPALDCATRDGCLEFKVITVAGAYMLITLPRNGCAAVKGIVLALAVFASSSALAQECSTISLPGPAFPGGGNATPFANVVPGFATGLAAANAIAGTLTATNTAFLTQSTSFVSAPGNAAPNSEGGGIWVRGVGGDLSIKSASTVNAGVSVQGGGSVFGAGGCNSKFQQTFGGFQLGQDISRLNFGDWNVHIGSTAGLIETKGNIAGGNLMGGTFNSTTQAPFVGTYAAATHGGFFIDGMARLDYYETNLDSPSINVFQQNLDAHGVALIGSLGYNWKVPNSNWFIEPSAGVIWSRTTVDPFNTSNPVTAAEGYNPGNFQGTAQIGTINSTIGRAGVRFGTTIESGNVVWQPFAAVSVWHEFDSGVSANYASCPNCAFEGNGAFPSSITAAIASQSIGTFGQYSLGLSGQIANTGWLGFVRVDYRDGPRLEGIDGTGGIRYQFTPAAAPGGAVMPLKAPVYKAPRMTGPYNWGGFYLGGFGGAGYGRAPDGFPADGGTGPTPKVAGATFGGEVGYNYQFGEWVVGAEGDGGWANIKGTSPCVPLGAAVGLVPTPLFQMNCQDKIDWIATATGRFGYAVGRVLYYGKAGAAWTRDNFTASCNLGPQNFTTLAFTPTAPGQLCANPAGLGAHIVGLTIQGSNGFSASDERVGWTAGFGAEFGLTPNWSAKGELDYIDFGSRNLVASDGSAVNASLHVVEAKIGLNYHFAQ